MDGLLSQLTGPADDALCRRLRGQFVWHVIPMLNPDGVAAGNYRCSLAGCDLNRQWADPSEHRHPEIFACTFLRLLSLCSGKV